MRWHQMKHDTQTLAAAVARERNSVANRLLCRGGLVQLDGEDDAERSRVRKLAQMELELEEVLFTHDSLTIHSVLFWRHAL